MKSFSSFACSLVGLTCLLSPLALGSDASGHFTSLLKIGDDPQKVISSVGPILIYRPFEEQRAVEPENVVDNAVYLFKKKIGDLSFSGGVGFIEQTVAFWGAGTVVPDLDDSALSHLLQPLVNQLGQPDSIGAVTCTEFKTPINVPVANWKRGGVTYAVAWKRSTDLPGWLEFKVIKDGTLDGDFPIFPVHSMTKDERDSVIKDGTRQFRDLLLNRRTGSE